MGRRTAPRPQVSETGSVLRCGTRAHAFCGTRAHAWRGHGAVRQRQIRPPVHIPGAMAKLLYKSWSRSSKEGEFCVHVIVDETHVHEVWHMPVPVVHAACEPQEYESARPYNAQKAVHGKSAKAVHVHGKTTKAVHGKTTKAAHVHGKTTKAVHGKTTKAAHGKTTKAAHGKSTKAARGKTTKAAHGKSPKEGTKVHPQKKHATKKKGE